jgi:cytidine deaminase
MADKGADIDAGGLSLYRQAEEALKRAHAPYSSFNVGAAVRAGSGRIYSGCNVENVSYGLSVCAERVAVFTAVCEGETRIEALALASSAAGEVLPCGACLQVLAEFADKNLVIYYPGGEGVIKKTTLGALFPRPFRLPDDAP